jgi:hypothetical protein
MDHAEAREILEIAAAEPGGLDRLMAGDTPDAAALAGHLAGCEICTLEMARLGRDSRLIAEAIRTALPPELRQRTLDLVAAVGRDRSATAASPSGVAASIDAPGSLDRPAPPSRRLAATIGARLAAVAAVVALSVGASALFVAGQQDRAMHERDVAFAEQQEVVSALVAVTTSTLQVEGEPDAHKVKLSSATGGDAMGTIIFSPSTGEIVVVAEALAPPSEGRELRSWVELNGRRVDIGRLFFAGGLAYWVGDVRALAAVRRGATFGISEVDPAGGDQGGSPVLVGRL